MQETLHGAFINQLLVLYNTEMHPSMFIVLREKKVYTISFKIIFNYRSHKLNLNVTCLSRGGF